jgi:hypothetical protein
MFAGTDPSFKVQGLSAPKNVNVLGDNLGDRSLEDNTLSGNIIVKGQ